MIPAPSNRRSWINLNTVWKAPHDRMFYNYNSGEQDASIAATTMMYEAEELGIHSVWLRGFDEKTISEVFELPSFGSVYNTIRKHLEGSLDRLQTDYVDIYYLHRMSGIPVEKVAESMGRLMEDGLIRGWGFSQVDVDIIDRAQQVTPLAAIQNIYSMVERDSEAEIIPYCMENNIGFVPFSPIASGLLSGKITPQTQFERNDDALNSLKVYGHRGLGGF